MIKSSFLFVAFWFFCLFFFLKQGDSNLNDGFFCFLLYFLHLFAEMILEVDGVFLGVDIDFSWFVERLQVVLLHFSAGLLLKFCTVSGYGDDFALFFEVLRDREVVLESQLLELSRLASLVWLEWGGKLQFLIHLSLLLYIKDDQYLCSLIWILN